MKTLTSKLYARGIIGMTLTEQGSQSIYVTPIVRQSIATLTFYLLTNG